jgi:hypothetical protein
VGTDIENLDILGFNDNVKEVRRLRENFVFIDTDIDILKTLESMTRWLRRRMLRQ